MDNAIDKDWEKEFSTNFTKKIPFPMLKYECGRLNPNLDNVIYTLANASVHDDTKFELYCQPDTKEQLDLIVEELKKAQPAKPPTTKNEKMEEKKKETEDALDDNGIDPNPTTDQLAPTLADQETHDYTEKALIQLASRRADERKARREEEAKNALEKETKKNKEKENQKENEKDDDDKSEENEEKKNDDSEFSKENIPFLKVETEDTFGFNLKKCKKILTMWEVKSGGYRKLHETFLFDPVNTTFEFSLDGTKLLLACTDSKTFVTYDALTLTRLKKFELKAKDTNGNDITYFYDAKLSKNGNYILSGDSYTRYVFDNEGKFLNSCSGRNMYTIYMYSDTEFAGVKNADETYTKTHLVAVDFLKDTERELFLFDSYVSYVNFNKEFTAFTFEVYPKIKYRDLRDKNAEAKEIISNYYSVYKYAFKGNKTAILYSINYNSLMLVVFEDGVQKWKQTIKKSYMDTHGLEFSSGDVESVMLLELYNSTFQVYIFEENFSTDYCIKSIRNITFKYPTLAYAWGTREIWVQDLYNNVKIYRFDATISGMENCCNVKNNTSDQLKLGVVLDYTDYFRIGEFHINGGEDNLVISKRRINKSELPSGKVKAFYNIRVHNYESKSIDDGVMLHFKDSLIILSMMSRSIKNEIKKTVNKANVITLKNESAIFFWEDKGDKIEMMKIPYDPKSEKAMQKVYEADESLLLVKTTVIDEEEYIYVVDEPKSVKILKIEDSRVTVHKNYFVDPYFATYADVQSLKQYSYCNGMMYSSSGGYVLQEKGKEKEFKFSSLYYGSYSLDYGNTKFPMCTEEFILWSLSPEYSSDYTSQKQYLLLTPPMNSYRIKQRTVDKSRNYEVFLHFDDKYIVFTDYYVGWDDQYVNYGSNTLTIYQLNGEKVQTVKLPSHYQTYKSVFSQSGEFIAVPCRQLPTQEEQDHFYNHKEEYPNNMYNAPESRVIFVYKIKKAEVYVRQSTSNNLNEIQDVNAASSKPNEIISIEAVKCIRLPKEFSYVIADREDVFEQLMQSAWCDTHPLHVDNKGNLIFLNMEWKCFFINDTNLWDKFFSM